MWAATPYPYARTYLVTVRGEEVIIINIRVKVGALF